MKHTSWEVVIGLEVHLQLKTRSKIFSGTATTFGADPNKQANPIDLGLPGTLPVLNDEAVRLAIQFGLAVGARINSPSIFARKNYFYPDLPKGYQISQHEAPIVEHGHLDIRLDEYNSKRVLIQRAHLEEDAGKSLHEGLGQYSGIDFNRAGIPLLEIVSAPDLRSAQEAVCYLKTLHSLTRYLDLSDANLQEGSFRVDANVSIRPVGSDVLGTRTEIKNINSFRFVEKAILYEAERQMTVLEQGGKVLQETRLYDPDRHETRPMRSKESANDYRYFPEPDLLPLFIEPSEIERLRTALPELPQAKQQRFQETLGLNFYDASVLTQDRETARYFEAVLEASHQELPTTDAKLAAHWVLGEIAALLNKHQMDISHCPVKAPSCALLLRRIQDKTLSQTLAKSVFEQLWENPEQTVDGLIETQGLRQVRDPETLERSIQDVLDAFPKQLAEYKSGKDKLFGFFVGQAMKQLQGKADPVQLNLLLKKALDG